MNLRYNYVNKTNVNQSVSLSFNATSMCIETTVIAKPTKTYYESKITFHNFGKYVKFFYMRDVKRLELTYFSIKIYMGTDDYLMIER